MNSLNSSMAVPGQYFSSEPLAQSLQLIKLELGLMMLHVYVHQSIGKRAQTHECSTRVRLICPSDAPCHVRCWWIFWSRTEDHLCLISVSSCALTACPTSDSHNTTALLSPSNYCHAQRFRFISYWLHMDTEHTKYPSRAFIIEIETL